jgi:hypothetical protein
VVWVHGVDIDMIIQNLLGSSSVSASGAGWCMRSLSPSPHSRQLPFTSPAGTESSVGLPTVPTASTRTAAVTRSTTRTLVDRMVALLLTIDPNLETGAGSTCGCV